MEKCETSLVFVSWILVHIELFLTSISFKYSIQLSGNKFIEIQLKPALN